MQPTQDQGDPHQLGEQPAQVPSAASPVVTLSPDESSWVPQVSAQSAEDDIKVSDDEALVRWSATEYIHHDKNTLWFVGFIIVTIVFILLAIFLIKSITFAILIPVMAAALLMYAYRPPRILNYTLSRHGLHANDHLYHFSEFKGFAVIHGEDEYSVMLIPTKRFKPGVSVYFPEDAGEEIVDMLATRLPMQELHIDFVDRIIQKLRI
jgi:hypothetical protein